MKKLLLLVAAVMLTAAPAKAATVNLGLDPTPWNTDTAVILTVTPTAPGQQVTNLPCIICGANQPQQPAGFGYNLFGNTGNADTVSFFSTAVVPPGPGSGLAIDQFVGATGYSLLPGAPLLTAIGGFNGFSIGVDSNQAGGKVQTLESFWFLNLTTHTVLAVFSPTPGDGLDITPLNNGTGFPDFTINGLTLAGVSPGDQIMFFARITGANDGPDSFFLIPNAQADVVPIPGAVWLFASGAAGLGFLMRRRKNKVAAQAAA